MISRRQFLRIRGRRSVPLGVSTAAYGVGRAALAAPRRALRNLAAALACGISSSRSPSSPTFTPAIPGCRSTHIEAIVERTNALDADIVVMLGDYVAGHRHVTRQYCRPMNGRPCWRSLKAPLGVHAILGNHDYWDDRTVQQDGQGKTVAHRALEAAGIPVYENDVARLTKDGRSLLARRPRRSARLLPGATLHAAVGRIGVDDLDAHACEGHRRCAGHPAGA